MACKLVTLSAAPPPAHLQARRLSLLLRDERLGRRDARDEPRALHLKLSEHCPDPASQCCCCGGGEGVCVRVRRAHARGLAQAGRGVPLPLPALVVRGLGVGAPPSPRPSSSCLLRVDHRSDEGGAERGLLRRGEGRARRRRWALAARPRRNTRARSPTHPVSPPIAHLRLDGGVRREEQPLRVRRAPHRRDDRLAMVRGVRVRRRVSRGRRYCCPCPP